MELISHMSLRHIQRGLIAAALLAASNAGLAQVSAYTFSQSVGTWSPINGNGTPIGLVGLPDWLAIDDDSFVTEGESIPMSEATTGNGWPIGFNFTFNGIEFDRVGISMEGWIALGRSSQGNNAVFVPIGSSAYTPLSSASPEGLDPIMRYRIAGFAADMAPGGGLSSWPVQLRLTGTAPNRTFITEFNCQRSGALGTYAFQIRLNEGGGIPSAQTVQVVYGTMTPAGTVTGQVGLGGETPADFNNRSVTVAPYNWAASEAGTANTATCRVPATATNLPVGTTFTWSPPACSVFGILVDQFVFVGDQLNATLSWNPTFGATTYDYVVTAGGPTDTPVASGNGLTATTATLSDLPLGQELFAYVRAHCASQTPTWSAPHAFNTSALVPIACGQAPLQETYCYVDYEQRTWTYLSSTGDPLRLILHAGTMGVGDVLTCHDGPTINDTQIFSSAVTSTLPGQVVNSTGGALTLRISADELSSCSNTEWLEELEWEVGCVDCDPVLANFSVTNDCDNSEFSVNVAIFNMGSATSVVITAEGASPVTANTLGQHTIGPFPIGTPVVVSAGNPDNDYCSALSQPLLNDPCPVVSCGPDAYNYCYTEDDASQRVYTASGSERIGVRFLSGSLAGTDEIRFYDGPDVFSNVLGSTVGGDLTGLIITSSAASNTILIEASSGSAGSCEGGQATPWNYIVACYDGCDAPEATFSIVDDCDAGQFSIVVDLTSLGSATQVVIGNNAGAASITATVANNFTVGPFTNGTQVVITLDGASEICSLNSIALTDGCGVGIQDIEQPRLMIYPDPGNGLFNVVLPRGFGGSAELEVLDLTGRRVQWERLMGQSGQVIPFDLSGVPAGSYVVVIRNGENATSSTLRVVH